MARGYSGGSRSQGMRHPVAAWKCHNYTGRELTYLPGTNLPSRGGGDVPSNSHNPNSRRPNKASVRPGDSQRQPLPVPPSEAVDVGAAHPSEVLLQYGEPGSELTTPLPAPVRKRHRVDDVKDDFAGRTASSMSEPSESAI